MCKSTAYSKLKDSYCFYYLLIFTSWWCSVTAKKMYWRTFSFCIKHTKEAVFYLNLIVNSYISSCLCFSLKTIIFHQKFCMQHGQSRSALLKNYTGKFQLMSGSSRLTDLNLTNHIAGVMDISMHKSQTMSSRFKGIWMS